MLLTAQQWYKHVIKKGYVYRTLISNMNLFLSFNLLIFWPSHLLSWSIYRQIYYPLAVRLSDLTLGILSQMIGTSQPDVRPIYIQPIFLSNMTFVHTHFSCVRQKVRAEIRIEVRKKYKQTKHFDGVHVYNTYV